MIKPENKNQLLTNLKKARGSIEKVIEMVENEKYCLEVAQQLNASLGLLRSANSLMLKNHLQTCGAKKMASPNKKTRDEFVNELVRVFDVSSRK
ncbi:metal-sensitive transcriptional regulator [Candidatus Gracilibacteria bacterium]|nr:metal-sensitive transcriptional regulator [Candidatus Gracilibacteria bacterium]